MAERKCKDRANEDNDRVRKDRKKDERWEGCKDERMEGKKGGGRLSIAIAPKIARRNAKYLQEPYKRGVIGSRQFKNTTDQAVVMPIAGSD